MKRNTFLRRFLSFVVALLMVVTMIDWSGFRVVAEAATYGTYVKQICYYNPEWKGESELKLIYENGGNYTSNSKTLKPTISPGTGWFYIATSELDAGAQNANAFIFKKADLSAQSDNFYLKDFTDRVTYLMDSSSSTNGRVITGGTGNVRDAYSAGGSTTIYCYSASGVKTGSSNCTLTDGIRIYSNSNYQTGYLGDSNTISSATTSTDVNGTKLVRYTYSKLDASKAPLLFQATKSGESTKTDPVLITTTTAYVNLDTGKVYATEDELRAALNPAPVTGGLKRVQYYNKTYPGTTQWKLFYSTDEGMNWTASDVILTAKDQNNTGWFYADASSITGLPFGSSLKIQFKNVANLDQKSDSFILAAPADDFYCVQESLASVNTRAFVTAAEARAAYNASGTTTIHVYVKEKTVATGRDLYFIDGIQGINQEKWDFEYLYTDFGDGKRDSITDETLYKGTSSGRISDLINEKVTLKKIEYNVYNASKKTLLVQFHNDGWWPQKLELNASEVWVAPESGKVYLTQRALLEGEGLVALPQMEFYYYNPDIPTVYEKSGLDKDIYYHTWLHYSTDDGATWNNVQAEPVADEIGKNAGWYTVKVDKPEGDILFYYSGMKNARGETSKDIWWGDITLDAANELKNTWRSDDFKVAPSDTVYTMDAVAMGDDIAGRAITTESTVGGKKRIVTSAADARSNFYAGGTTEIYVYGGSRTYDSADIRDGVGTLKATPATSGDFSKLTVSGINAAVDSLMVNLDMKYKKYSYSISDTHDKTGNILVDKNPAYINADTGVVYGSKEELEAGLESTIHIKSSTAITAISVEYGTRLKDGKLQSSGSQSLTANKEGDWYSVVVPVDAANTYYDSTKPTETRGYKLSYKYGNSWIYLGGRTGSVVAPDGLSKNEIYLEVAGGTAKIYDRVVAHLYNESTSATVKADVYAGGLNASEKVLQGVTCTRNGNWYTVDTGLNPDDYPDGVYVIFKVNGTATKAYQFENSERTWVMPNMTMFRTQDDAMASLAPKKNDNEVESGKVRVWFYHPGGWKNYYIGYPSAAGYDHTGMTVSKEYPGWHSAVIDQGVTTIYFDEDKNHDNGGNHTADYNLTGNQMNIIFATADTSILEEGWSVSSAEIQQAYNLLACPESNALTLPVTFFDYAADNLFFEYDQTYLKNMTMVKGTNYNLYNQIGTTIYGTDQAVDRIGYHFGQAPTFDRNGELYSQGLVETMLVNGAPVYSRQTIERLAEVIYRGIQFNMLNPETKTYNRTKLYEDIEALLWKNGAMALGDYDTAKNVTSLANVHTCMDYVCYITNNLFRESEVAKDYGMYKNLILQKTNNNIFSFYGNYQTNSNTGDGLVQNKPITYDPYRYDEAGNVTGGTGSITNNMAGTEWEFVGLGNNRYVIQNATARGSSDGYNGYAGFFPLHKDLMDRSFGTPAEGTPDSGEAGSTNTYKYYTYTNPALGEGGAMVEFTDNAFLKSWFRENASTWDTELVKTSAYDGDEYKYDSVDYFDRNYHYGMKSSGKFRYNRADDLYFTFTGDDDVFLFIDGKVVMELGAAHAAASYTVYLNDLVDFKHFQMEDGKYYDFDFFYMERHTEWSNIRIETNIDVIDVSGRVIKNCYYGEENKDGAPASGTSIPSGSAVEEGTSVTYSFTLTAGPDEGLSKLSFVDESLGIYLYADPEIPNVYGTYPNPNYDPEDPDSQKELPRTVTELKVKINDQPQTVTSDAQLKEILTRGIPGDGTIEISGIKWTMNKTTAGPVKATMYSEGAENDLTSSCGYVVYVDKEAIEVTKKVHDPVDSKKDLDGVLVPLNSGAAYTLKLENTGTSHLTTLKLVDNDLHCEFYAASVDGHYYKFTELNTTVPSDLTITVSGTGMQDGVYHPADGDELDEILAKVMNTVYPTGASITIDGIRYPVKEKVYPSTVVGTAQNIEYYSLLFDEAGNNKLEEYTKAYIDWDGTPGNKPNLDDYVGAKDAADTSKHARYRVSGTKIGDEDLTDVQIAAIDKYIKDYAVFARAEAKNQTATEPPISTTVLYGNQSLRDEDKVCVLGYNNKISIDVDKIAHKPEDKSEVWTESDKKLEGTDAGYTIKLTNNNDYSVTDLNLTDNDLGVRFNFEQIHYSPIKTEKNNKGQWEEELAEDVEFVAWAEAPYTFHLSQTVTVSDAGEYTLSADLVPLGGADCNEMKIVVKSADGTELKTIDLKDAVNNAENADRKLTDVKEGITIESLPAGAVTVEFVGNFKKSGIRLDDVKLVKADTAEAPNLIQNSAFDVRNETVWPYLPDQNTWKTEYTVFSDYFILNDSTEIKDLTITVTGAQVGPNTVDGVTTYTFNEGTTVADFNAVLSQVMNAVYPKGASIEISGIQYPINKPVFPSTVKGTAKGVEGYELLSNKLNAYVEVYDTNRDLTPAKAAAGGALAGAEYLKLSEDKIAVVEAYIDAYAKYMCGETTVCPDASKVVPFFSGREVEDDAKVVLCSYKEPQIVVSEEAYDLETDAEYPTGTLLEFGTEVGFAVRLENCEETPVTDLVLEDADLGVKFYFEPKGSHYFKLNDETEAKDLTIIVKNAAGETVEEHKVTDDADLDQILSRLMNDVYQKGESIEIRGIKHTLEEPVFPSAVTGNAKGVEYYPVLNKDDTSISLLDQFVENYKNDVITDANFDSKLNEVFADAEFKDLKSETQEKIKDYIKAYAKYKKDPGSNPYPDVTKYIASTGTYAKVLGHGGNVTGNAEVILYAKGSTEIEVKKNAYDLTTGDILPDGSVLHKGELAGYTISLKNNGTGDITDLQLVDDDLHVAFYAEKPMKDDGVTLENHYFKLNKYTKVTDLIITVKDKDGHVVGEPYTAPNETKLDQILQDLMNDVYAPGTSIEITGIKYPVNDPIFPSTVNGKAKGAELYSVLFPVKDGKNLLETYADAYKEAKKENTELPQVSTVLTGTAYDTLPVAQKEAVKKYVEDYAKYREDETNVKPDITTYTYEIPGAEGEEPTTAYAFGEFESLTGSADTVLGAEIHEYEYFSEAGQVITPQLVTVEEVTVHRTSATGFVATMSEAALAEGVHTVTILGDVSLAEDLLTIKDDDGNSLKDENGNPVKAVIVKSKRGEYTTVSFPVDGDNAGKNWHITINGKTAEGTDAPEKLNVVMDNQPEDYRIVKVTVVGENDRTVELMPEDVDEQNPDPQEDETYHYVLEKETTDNNGTPETVVKVEATIDNSGLYPVVSYRSDNVKTVVFHILPLDEDVESEFFAEPELVKVHTYKLNDDVYVLDYGLKVELSKQDNQYNNNGMFKNDNVAIDKVLTTAKYFGLKKERGTSGIYAADGFVDTLTNIEDKQNGVSATMTYGIVESTDDADAGNYANAKVTYTMNKFMEGIDTFHYGAQVAAKGATVKNVETATPVMYAKVTILPATIVYYEDNFGGLNYSTGVNSDVENIKNHEQNNSLTTQYGFDEAYVGDTEYSNGTHVELKSGEKFGFAFKGTGFEILTRTSNTSLLLRVYDAATCKLDTTGGNVKVVGKDGQTPFCVKNALVSATYEHGFVDQIPLISLKGLPYTAAGAGYVVIAQTLGSFDTIKLDGVRIYDPLGPNAGNYGAVNDEFDVNVELPATVENIKHLIMGKAKDEKGKDIIDTDKAKASLVKNVKIDGAYHLYLGAGESVVEAYTGEFTSKEGLTPQQVAAMVSNAQPAGSSNDLMTYLENGPSNELYLNGSAYAVGIKLSGIKEKSFLHVGMKAIGGTASVKYLSGKTNDWEYLDGTTALKSAMELYYKIPLDDLWNGCLLLRAESGTVAITNVKHSNLTLSKLETSDFGTAGAIEVKETDTIPAAKILTRTIKRNNQQQITLTFTMNADVDVFSLGQKTTVGEIVTPVFTYTASAPLHPTETVSVSRKVSGDTAIYVVKLNGYEAGDYVISAVHSTSEGVAYQNTPFTVQDAAN